MKRILVIGGNGSGKSTFAKALAKKTGLPAVHLDKIFWKGNREYISREEFDQKPETGLIKNYGKTRDDMPENSPEKFDFDFYKAVLRFNKKNRPKTKALLKKYEPKVIVLKNRKQAKEYLNSL